MTGAADELRPTLWIGSDGEEEEDATEDPGRSRSPGNLLVTTACIGMVLAALAYALDFPLS